MDSESLESPVRPKQRRVSLDAPKFLTVVELQVDARVGDPCHFGGFLVYCEIEVRVIDALNAITNNVERTYVMNLVLADAHGAIHVTLRRQKPRKNRARHSKKQWVKRAKGLALN